MSGGAPRRARSHSAVRRVRRRCDELDESHIDKTLDELAGRAARSDKAVGGLGDFTGNRNRMRRREFRAMGLCVSTGVVGGAGRFLFLEELSGFRYGARQFGHEPFSISLPTKNAVIAASDVGGDLPEFSLLVGHFGNQPSPDPVPAAFSWTPHDQDEMGSPEIRR